MFVLVINQQVKERVHAWLVSQPKTLRLYRLVAQWTECVENKHDYVEKLCYCTNWNNTVVFKKQYILGTFWLTQMVVQGVESNASCFLFYATTNLGMWKLYTKSRNIAEVIVILQCSLQLCQQSFSALEQRHLFLPKKSLSLICSHQCMAFCNVLLLA